MLVGLEEAITCRECRIVRTAATSDATRRAYVRAGPSHGSIERGRSSQCHDRLVGLRRWAKEACMRCRHPAGDATHGAYHDEAKEDDREAGHAGHQDPHTAGSGCRCAKNQTRAAGRHVAAARGRYHRPDRQGAGLAAAQCARRDLRLTEEEAGPQASNRIRLEGVEHIQLAARCPRSPTLQKCNSPVLLSFCPSPLHRVEKAI